MVDPRQIAAKTICDNMQNYSVDEVINAIRYFGNTQNAREISKIIGLSLSSSLLKLGWPKIWKVSILEAIKQLEFIDAFQSFEHLMENPDVYDQQHHNEAVRIATNRDYYKYLQYIIQNPDQFNIEVRKKANEGLFQPRTKSTVLDYVEPEPEFRGKLVGEKKPPLGLKQVFISYKKSDQRFANEVVSYLSEFYRDEFEILYDEFEVVAGDSLPKALNTMLDRSETSMMVWSPEYFSESGWASVEKDGILSKRVREGKRFVPLFFRGNSGIIPTLFSQYVYVDFRDYEKNNDPVLFRKQMEKVIEGLRKES